MFLAVSVGDRLHAKEKKRTGAEERERHVSTRERKIALGAMGDGEAYDCEERGPRCRDAYTPRRHAPWVAAGRFHLRPAWRDVAKRQTASSAKFRVE
jgi:hypothetical protein